MCKLGQNQSGSISMITVIFLALLLSIITISFIRLSISEQRQAIDDDLSTRAFYAAESGVEDAKRAIDLYLDGQMTLEELDPEGCEPANNSEMAIDVDASGYSVLSDELDTAYTCQMINMNPSDFQAQLSAGDSITVPLKTSSAYSQITIEWHNDDDGASTPNTHTASGGIRALETKSMWISHNHPAMLRARIFSTPNGAVTRSSIESRTAYLNPGSSVNPTYNLTSAFDQRVIDGGTCSGASGYRCRVVITNVNSGRMNYLRLMSIYRDTHIRITLSDSSGNLVEIEDVQAIVDVTGKSGDVFRRVEARLSLLEDSYPFPDYVLWSNDEICKNFRVTDQVSEFYSGSPECDWIN